MSSITDIAIIDVNNVKKFLCRKRYSLTAKVVTVIELNKNQCQKPVAWFRGVSDELFQYNKKSRRSFKGLNEACKPL